MTSLWDELDTMQIQTNKDSYECWICDNVFTSPIQLTVHCIVLHGLLPCMHCLKLFESEHLLDDHIRTQHDCEKHICPECSHVFLNRNEFEMHIFLQHSKKLCELCGLLTSIDEQQQHLSTLHKVMHDSVRIFLASINQNEFPCHLCSDRKSIDCLGKLLLHYLYFHKCSLQSLLERILKDNDIKCLISLSSSNEIHTRCSICGLNYTWSVPKIYHKIYCQGFIYCINCTDCFDTKVNFDEHQKSCASKKSSKIYFCDSCTSSTIDDPHFVTAHKNSTVGWSQATSLLNADNYCNFCALNLNSEAIKLNEIISHFRTLHNFSATAILSYLNKSNNKTKTEKNAKPGIKRARENIAEIRAIDGDENVQYLMNFDTKHVKYIYSSASDYDSSDSDENTNQPVVTYECDLCDYRSRSKFMHVMHMHRKHGFALKMPEFRCNVCRKLFASNRSLKKHNRNSHHKRTTATRFNCPFCDFGCNAKMKMR